MLSAWRNIAAGVPTGGRKGFTKLSRATSPEKPLSLQRKKKKKSCTTGGISISCVRGIHNWKTLQNKCNHSDLLRYRCSQRGFSAFVYLLFKVQSTFPHTLEGGRHNRKIPDSMGPMDLDKRMPIILISIRLQVWTKISLPESTLFAKAVKTVRMTVTR